MPNTRGAFALHRWATAARAARPASLASSARTEALDAVALQASARAARPLASGVLPEPLVGSVFYESLVRREACLSKALRWGGREDPGFVGRACSTKTSMFGKARLHSQQTQALRSSAKPKAGRAATSFARGGGFGLFASGATQRTMRAGRVPLGARSNPLQGLQS